MHVIGCMASAGSGEVGREALRRAQAAAAQALNPSLASTVTASTAPGYAHRQSFSARRTDEASQLPAATQRQGLLLILLVLLFHLALCRPTAALLGTEMQCWGWFVASLYWACICVCVLTLGF